MNIFHEYLDISPLLFIAVCAGVVADPFGVTFVRIFDRKVTFLEIFTHSVTVTVSNSKMSALHHNELLCYGTFNVSRSTAVSLTNCIVEFYNCDEIYEARELLWDSFKDFLRACSHKKTRRTQPPTDKHSARPFVEDICKWLQCIANARDPVDVKFYALDLRRIPPCPPEEINIFSLVARIEALEKKAASSIPSASDPSIRPAPRPHPQAAAAPSSSDAWTTVVKKKKKKGRSDARRRVHDAAKQLTVVRGTNSDTQLKGCKPLKHLFVYGVEKSCSPEILKEYLANRSVQAKEVRRISKDAWSRASFKVTVEEAVLEQLLIAEFWPDGILCREWVQSSPKSKGLPSNPGAHPSGSTSQSTSSGASLPLPSSEGERSSHPSLPTSSLELLHQTPPEPSPPLTSNSPHLADSPLSDSHSESHD